jgi:hypothetical protein
LGAYKPRGPRHSSSHNPFVIRFSIFATFILPRGLAAPTSTEPTEREKLLAEFRRINEGIPESLKGLNVTAGLLATFPDKANMTHRSFSVGFNNPADLINYAT